MKKISAITITLVLAFVIVSAVPAKAHAEGFDFRGSIQSGFQKFHAKFNSFFNWHSNGNSHGNSQSNDNNDNKNKTKDHKNNKNKGNNKGDNENDDNGSNSNGDNNGGNTNGDNEGGRGNGTTTSPFLGALRISNIRVVKATTTATITWNTNVSTYSEIRFGSTTPISTTTSATQTDGTLGTTHSVTLTGLNPDTIYYYIIVAHDSSSNERESGTRQFRTDATSVVQTDTTAPKIVYSSTFQTMATSSHLIWFTDEPTTAKVWLSTTTPVDTSGTPTQSFTNLSYFQNIMFNNLATSTTYYYTIFVTDASNNSTTLNGGTFTTPAI